MEDYNRMKTFSLDADIVTCIEVFCKDVSYCPRETQQFT